MKLLKINLYLFITCLFFSLGCDGCDITELDNRVSAPQFSLQRGTYYTINMSSCTDGASVKYTTDGSDPLTSDSAIVGNSAVISYFTKLKAYAYKEDLVNSEVVCYDFQTSNKTQRVVYNSDDTVNYYYYYELDGNEQRIHDIYYDEKGDDGQWFTEDDRVAKYHLYTYDSTGLIKESIYNAKGADGEWITPDDSLDFYYVYENDADKNPTKKSKFSSSGELQQYTVYQYTSGVLTSEEGYDASDVMTAAVGYVYSGDDMVKKNVYEADGVTVAGYFDYTYNSSVAATESEKNSSDAEIGYSEYSYDNNEFYYTYQYNGSGLLETETGFRGYGADTESSVIVYTYNSDNKIDTKSVYTDPSKTTWSLYTEYTYNSSGNLTGEISYSDSRKETVLSSVVYAYDTGSRLSRKTNYEDDQSTILNYVDCSYDASNNKIKEILYEKPQPNQKTISFNLSLSAGIIDGGFYTMGGINYNIEGDPIGSIIDIESYKTDIVKSVKDKAEEIFDNSELTDNGVVITGVKGGNVKISVWSTGSNSIKVFYKFNGYNDGDFQLDGSIVKEIEGQLELTGNVTGSLDGEIVGDITITDADANWSEDDYEKVSYATFEYDGSNNLLKETCFNSTGDDGEWDSSDDTIYYIKKYEYNSDGYISKMSYYCSAGDDETWDNSDDEIKYYNEYIYDDDSDTDSLDRMRRVKNYGVYKVSYDDSSMATKVSSFFEYPIEE